MKKNLYWIGYLRNNNREVFGGKELPTPENYPQYALVWGPFRIKKIAEWCKDHSRNNPHIQTVSQGVRVYRQLEREGKL